MKMPTQYRSLAPGERAIAGPVFKGTIPYDVIRISDGAGADNRPFTVPAQVQYSWLQAMTIAGPPPTSFSGFKSAIRTGLGIDRPGGAYFINGNELFSYSLTTASNRATLIHELTHIWQAVHRKWQYSYMLSSMLGSYTEQGISGYDQYAYNPNKLENSFDDYNAEQQAHIVEDWFAGGMLSTDPRFRFIRDNIWH